MVHPHVVLVTSPFGHGAETKCISRKRADWIHDLFRRCSKGLAVLVQDDARITQVHPKGIAHPMKAFLDVIRQISASSRRTQAQTHSEWVEYCSFSSLDILGCTALAAAQKRMSILEPKM